MRKHYLFEQEESGETWIATYTLGYSEFDDSFEDSDTVEISFNAESFDIAVRYAQQYLRKMKSEEETADKWQDAEILAVELY